MVTVEMTGHSSRRSTPPRWTPTGNGLQRGQPCWPPLGRTVGRQRAATWPPVGRISWPPTESERLGHQRSERQWRASLETHAAALMDRPVDEITIRDVKKVLQPIWNEKSETAGRVRQRIHIVMRRAVAEGYRLDNPAGEEVVEALGPRSSRKQHVRSLPHSRVEDAVAAVEESQAHPATKLSFEFIALTACRPGEVYGCRWAEIDLEGALWPVPASRTKTGVRHRVPLAKRALEVLAEAQEHSGGSALVFPSRTGRMISDGTISRTLERLSIDCTPHGMRASFRSWCADTGQNWEAAELALGHVVTGVQGAYQRSDLLDVRRKIMADWAAYLKPAQPLFHSCSRRFGAVQPAPRSVAGCGCDR